MLSSIMLGINRLFSVPTLKSSANYHDWLTQLKMYLYAKDVWVCICVNPTASIFRTPATVKSPPHHLHQAFSTSRTKTMMTCSHLRPSRTQWGRRQTPAKASTEAEGGEAVPPTKVHRAREAGQVQVHCTPVIIIIIRTKMLRYLPTSSSFCSTVRLFKTILKLLMACATPTSS